MAQIPTRAELEQEIISRARQDPAFRQALLADPKQALARHFSIALAAGISLQVHEEDRTHLHLVLPAADDLAEGDLDRIAGGGADGGSFWGISSHFV